MGNKVGCVILAKEGLYTGRWNRADMEMSYLLDENRLYYGKRRMELQMLLIVLWVAQ
jgi:hypothetical protein